MEKLEKLTEVIDGLREDFDELNEKVGALLAELKTPEPDPEPEITLDEVREMVKRRLDEERIAKTGRLPD